MIENPTKVAAYPWHAVTVRSNFEQRVARALQGKGCEEFLPTYRSKRRWSDRVKEVDIPLFPGYVFSRFDWDRRLPVLTIPGIIGIVSFGAQPAPIPDAEIEGIRLILHSKLFATPWPFLREGQLVELVKGPLTGLDGILVRVNGQMRVVVSVTLLMRSVAVEVEGDWVKPVNAPRKSPAAAAFESRRIA